MGASSGQKQGEEATGGSRSPGREAGGCGGHPRLSRGRAPIRTLLNTDDTQALWNMPHLGPEWNTVLQHLAVQQPPLLTSDSPKTQGQNGSGIQFLFTYLKTLSQSPASSLSFLPVKCVQPCFWPHMAAMSHERHLPQLCLGRGNETQKENTQSGHEFARSGKKEAPWRSC